MSGKADRIDWPVLMQLGLGRLRLAPDVFWGMTPPEFFAALEGAGLAPARDGGFRRDTLASLMARFPDLPPDTGDPGHADLRE